MINIFVSALILEIKTLDKSDPITFMPHMEIGNKTLDISSSKSDSSITKTRTTLMLVQ